MTDEELVDAMRRRRRALAAAYGLGAIGLWPLWKAIVTGSEVAAAPGSVTVYVMLASMLAPAGVHVALWRCARCRTYLYAKFFARHCHACGAVLRR